MPPQKLDASRNWANSPAVLAPLTHSNLRDVSDVRDASRVESASPTFSLPTAPTIFRRNLTRFVGATFVLIATLVLATAASAQGATQGSTQDSPSKSKSNSAESGKSKSKGFDPIHGEPLEFEDADSLRNELSPTGGMVWKTVTTASGRTFQVLEPAGASDEDEAANNVGPEGSNRSGDSAMNGAQLGSVGAGRSGTAGVQNTAFGRPQNADRTQRPGQSGSAKNPTFEEWVSSGLIPGITSFGVYGGYSSTAGFQFAIPTDGTLAFRTGLTGFPGIGWLWTPGVELRFGQTPGTYSTDSGYAFSNLYLGETTRDTPNRSHWGLESGIGYRWILPDRRSVRWIAALEVGARWGTESGLPESPTIRAFWMIAS